MTGACARRGIPGSRRAARQPALAYRWSSAGRLARIDYPGGTPNSVYTHTDPKTGKAKQNAVYDQDGNVVAHVDFKNHG